MNCQHNNGVRTLVCKQCNKPFTIQNNNKKSESDARPDKNTQQLDEARQLEKTTNPNKRRRRRRLKPRSSPINDWRQLSKGSIIRVVGHSGPFYEGSDGIRQYMTEKGLYKVESIDANGINVVGIAPYTSGHQFIYMGPLVKSPICDNLYRDKHKLLAVLS
jgi:hypothetical protein